MKITWEVEDGYCGGSRPQYTEVPDEDLDECETDDEREKLIEEYVQDDFDQTVSFTIINKEEN